MSDGAFPGPVYVITPEPRPSGWADFVRGLVRIHTDKGGRQGVALFGSRERAETWIAANVPPPKVYKAFAFTDRDEFVAFLDDLAAHGAADVCYDPTDSATGLVPVADLLRLVRGA